MTGLLKGAGEIIATMRKDPSIEKMFKEMEDKGHAFSTVRMEDPNLVNILEKNGIK